MELRELSAFVAVVEEGGLSAAARRLNVSQPGLSQTISGLERELRVKLLTRSSTGARPTQAGAILLNEAQAVLARHQQAVVRMAQLSEGDDDAVLRLGIPLEFPVDVLRTALSHLATSRPGTKVQAMHMSTAEQVTALRAGGLEFGMLRERPSGDEFDALLVHQEDLGVLLSAERASELSSQDVVSLEQLSRLEWLAFPRADSPAWYDELTAILRSHGLGRFTDAPAGQRLIAEIKLAVISAGTAFAFAPSNWSRAIPDEVRWVSLANRPLVRRTWAAWPADSDRRDRGQVIAAFTRPAPGAPAQRS